MLQALIRTHSLHFIDLNGMPALPTRCQNGVEGCSWSTPYERETYNKNPVITSDGPVFTKGTRYRCATHETTIEAGVCDINLADEPNLSLNYHRLGNMRYEATLLTEAQATYVDTLTTASVRRRILFKWHSYALKIIQNIKATQKAGMLRTKKLQRSASLLLHVLLDFVPSEKSLQKVLLAIYQQLVLPHMATYNEAVCAFDGQLVRIDGTFKSATTVRQSDPTTRYGKKRIVQLRVAGAVLVAIGLEGLCLVEPRLVPWESGPYIYVFLTRDI